MRVAVGMKIANKLILSREIILDYLGGHGIITRILRMGVGSRSERERRKGHRETEGEKKERGNVGAKCNGLSRKLLSSLFKAL